MPRAYTQSNEVAVLVCGEFKRGKSSLVNALIGEDLCPVDDCIATASVSIIKYGAKAKVTRHFIDSTNRVVMENVDFSQIAQFSRGSAANIDNTIFLEIEIPAEKLKSGLCIIDTPGIGGLDARHLSLTSLALTKADCVLFVVDAGEPMSASELAFIEEKVAPFGRQLKIVLNKVDTLSEDQIPELVNDTRQKVSRQCPALNNVEVIPASMYQWQLYGLTGDDSYKNASNMQGIELGIDAIRRSYKDSLYAILKSAILQAANDTKETLQTQLQAISDPNPDLIGKLQERGKAIAQAKREFEQPNSKFNSELAALIEEAQNEVMAKFSTDSIILSSEKLEELLSSDYAQTSEGLQFVSAKLNDALVSLSVQLDKIIDGYFDVVMEKAQLSVEGDGLSYDSLLPSNMKPKKKSWSERGFNIVRHGVSGLAVFSAVSLIGGAYVIGAIGAIAMGWHSISSASRATRKAEIRQQIQPRLTIAINDLKTYVQNRFKVFSKTLKEMLIGRVAEMESEMMSIRIKMEECATDMQKIATQKSEIQKKIAFIDTMTNQLNLLLNNPFRTK